MKNKNENEHENKMINSMNKKAIRSRFPSYSYLCHKEQLKWKTKQFENDINDRYLLQIFPEIYGHGKQYNCKLHSLHYLNRNSRIAL